MSIQNVSSIGKASFQGNFKKTTEVKTAPNKIKDDKKKLALTLGGLATLGLVSAGIIYGIKTGKFGKAQQETQEQGQKIVEKSKELTKEQSEKIKGLIEGQKIPYTNNNKLAGRTTDKFYATFNGQDVIVEHKIKAVPHKGLGKMLLLEIGKQVNLLL